MNELLVYPNNLDKQRPIDIELFNRFIDYVDRKETTIKGYVKCLKPFATWLQDNSIAMPTRDDVKAYRDELETRNLAAGTQAQYLRAVKQFFKWTQSEGLYPNVAENVHGAKVRNDLHKKDALEPADVRAIEAAINRDTLEGKRLYAMFLLACVDGLRTVEISRANVGDLIYRRNVAYLMIQGKGHDEKDVPKALVPQVLAAIEDYLNARDDSYTSRSPLFASTSNRNKYGHIAPTTISSMLKDAMRKAGYDSSRITAHSLRHTAATSAFNSDMSLYEVQQLQGHANPATTEVYIHDRQQDEIETKGRARIYDYLHCDERATLTAKQSEAQRIINTLDATQLEQALSYLYSIQK